VQYCGNGGCGIASTITQVVKSEPERNDALGRIGVVPALVSPLLVGRMRRGPVELRANPIRLIA
jgi:hypothetical protein